MNLICCSPDIYKRNTMHKGAALIAASGPSLTRIDYRRVPADAKVFRLNNFFFEDKYYATRNVDVYYTHSGFLHGQYFNLHQLRERDEYRIGDIYTWDKPADSKHYTLATDAMLLMRNHPKLL